MERSNLDLENEINLELSRAHASADLLEIACTGDIDQLKEKTLPAIAIDLEARLARVIDLMRIRAKNERVAKSSAAGSAEVDTRPH